jgi:hypothetical protein
MLRARILQGISSAAAALLTAALIASALNASNLPVWIFIALPAAAASIAAVCKPMSWVLASVLGAAMSVLGAVGIVAYALSKI